VSPSKGAGRVPCRFILMNKSASKPVAPLHCDFIKRLSTSVSLDAHWPLGVAAELRHGLRLPAHTPAAICVWFVAAFLTDVRAETFFAALSVCSAKSHALGLAWTLAQVFRHECATSAVRWNEEVAPRHRIAESELRAVLFRIRSSLGPTGTQQGPGYRTSLPLANHTCLVNKR
jgi:hypothetical protein